MCIALVIPAYEPTTDFIEFCISIRKSKIKDVIIINDGSSEEYDNIFDEISKKCGFILLKHNTNKGKGRALKTAFEYILKEMDYIDGCVTADSDGQHSINDILACMLKLQENKRALILGSRCFDGMNIPSKSRFGNKFTSKIFKLLYKKEISDTQTGLRGVSREFIEKLVEVDGERFEFETCMLIEACKREIKIIEVPIETIYDSKKEHKTHFHAVKDSIRIYKLFVGQFVRFIFSSLSSCLIDLLLFTISVELIKDKSECYILWATFFARSISSIYNYIINYKFVFKSRRSYIFTGGGYFLLAIVIMLCSGMLVSAAHICFPVSEVVIKVCVDTILFVMNYKIQTKLFGSN